MKGRKRKPTSIKIAEGNPGKRPLNKREPKPDAGPMPAPTHLSSSAKAEWKRVTKAMAKTKVFTQVDRAMLSAYCEAWGRYVEACKVLERTGHVIRNPKGGLPIQSPFLRVANKAIEIICKIAPELGFTPASRTRIEVSGRTGSAEELDAFTGELRIAK